MRFFLSPCAVLRCKKFRNSVILTAAESNANRVARRVSARWRYLAIESRGSVLAADHHLLVLIVVIA
jgi:hypothetical protein